MPEFYSGATGNPAASVRDYCSGAYIAACAVAGISLDRITRLLAHFVLVVLACLMIITYVPQVSLALRDLFYK